MNTPPTQPTLAQQAVDITTKSRQLLWEHKALLQPATFKQLENLSEKVCKALHACQQGVVTTEAFLQFTVSTQETQHILWEAIVALDNRLAKATAELQGLRAQLARMLLREMACQFENKLYRYVITEGDKYSPVQVRTATVKKLQSEQHRQKKGCLKRITKAYPNVLSAVEQLKDDGASIAHAWTIKDEGTGQQRAVTKEDLQACIDSEHRDNIFKVDFEQVLKALDWLSGQLNEDLFVRTVAQTTGEEEMAGVSNA